LPEQKDIAIAPAGSHVSLQVPLFKLVSMVLIDYV
jgi:hypothetical protein